MEEFLLKYQDTIFILHVLPWKSSNLLETCGVSAACEEDIDVLSLGLRLGTIGAKDEELLVKHGKHAEDRTRETRKRQLLEVHRSSKFPSTATVAVHSLDAEPRSIGSYITLVSDVYNDDIDNNVEIMLFSQLPNQTAVRVAYYYYRKWSDETPADEAQYTFNYLNISQGARKDFSRNYTWYFDYLPEDYDQLTAITQVIVDTVPYTQTNTLKVEECSKTIGVATSTICNNDTCGYNCECQFACPARYKYISSVSSSTKFRCTANAVWNTEETICAPEKLDGCSKAAFTITIVGCILTVIFAITVACAMKKMWRFKKEPASKMFYLGFVAAAAACVLAIGLLFGSTACVAATIIGAIGSCSMLLVTGLYAREAMTETKGIQGKKIEAAAEL